MFTFFTYSPRGFRFVNIFTDEQEWHDIGRTLLVNDSAGRAVRQSEAIAEVSKAYSPEDFVTVRSRSLVFGKDLFRAGAITLADWTMPQQDGHTLVLGADGSLFLLNTAMGLAEKVTTTPAIVRDIVGIHAEKEWWK